MRTGTLVHIFLFALFLCTLIILSNQEKVQSRKKRFLIWPEGASRVQVIIGLGIPLDLKLETAIIGLFLKGNYMMPMNASVYEGDESVVFARRKKRSLSRWDIYKFLSQEAELRGHNGRSCVLKAICEAADTPVDQNYGLFEELFHSTFTPSTTTEKLSHHTDNEYLAAEQLGKTNQGKCNQVFLDCQQSFLDKFSDFYIDS